MNDLIELAINKAAAKSRQLVYFSNTGDNDLVWRYDLASNNGSEAIGWLAAPVSGNLSTCDVGNVTLALDFVDAQARAEPYLLTFTMASSSFFEPSRTILIELRATVSASADAELCTVELKNAEQLAVADTLAFTVTSIDDYGIRILDVAALTYSATIANDVLGNDVPCTVVYNVGSDKHGGECILPTVVWGEFILTILDSAGERVGNQNYNVSVSRCSDEYYWDGAGCVACDPKEVRCAKGSTLETVLLNPTYWREDASSPLRNVRSCAPRPENCLGTRNATDGATGGATSGATGGATGSVPDSARRALTAGSTFDQGCVEGAIGPLCAICKIGYAQTPELECTYCDPGSETNNKTAFAVLLGTLLVVAVLVATIRGHLVRWFCGSDGDAEGEEVDQAEKEPKLWDIFILFFYIGVNTIKGDLAKYRDKAKVLFTYFQIVSQQVGGCITVPWPSGYGAIIGKLDFLSLSFVPYFNASCLFPRTNFYTTLLTSTAGPIVVVAAIFVFYLARRERGASSDNSQLQAKVASLALAVSYLAFPNGSLVTFRAFACDWGFDDGQGFLKHDYSCSCTADVYVFGWQIYGACGVIGLKWRYVQLSNQRHGSDRCAYAARLPGRHPVLVFCAHMEVSAQAEP